MYKLINANEISDSFSRVKNECKRFEKHTKDLSNKANSIICSVKNRILTTEDEGLVEDENQTLEGIENEKKYIQEAISVLERDICKIQELARKSEILKKQINDITSYLQYEHDSIEDRLKRIASPYLIKEEFLSEIEQARNVGRTILLEGEDGVGKKSLIYAFGAYSNHNVIRITLHKHNSPSNLYFEMCPNDEHYILGPLGHAVLELCEYKEEQKNIPIVLIEGVVNSNSETIKFLINELEKDHITFNIGNFQEDFKTEVKPYVFLVNDNDLFKVPFDIYNACYPIDVVFPDKLYLVEIIKVHFPGAKQLLIEDVINKIFEIRSNSKITDKPSIREIIEWMKILIEEGHEKIEDIDNDHLKILLKNKEDHIHYKVEEDEEEYFISR